MLRDSRWLTKMVTTQLKVESHCLILHTISTHQSISTAFYGVMVFCCRLTRILLLSAWHQLLFPNWVKEHHQWSVFDWHRVSWSDECCLQHFRVNGQFRVRKGTRVVMDLACEQDVVQAGSGSIMVWDMLYWSSQGPVVKVVSVLMGITCHIFIYSNKIWFFFYHFQQFRLYFLLWWWFV